MFQFLRIWSSYRKTNKNRFDILLNSWVIIFCGSFIGIISLIDAIQAIQMDQIDVKFTKLLFLCVVLVVIHKVCTVTYNQKIIVEFIEQLQKLSSTFENKTNFYNAHKLYKKIFFFGIYSMNISVFVFMVAPAVLFQNKKLFFQPKISFLNLQESPTWELMFVFQSISAFIFTNITFGYDTVYCGIMITSAAILKSIAREIREVDGVIEDHQISEEKLKNIIEKIIEISGVTKNISDIFAMTTMVHIVYVCGTMALGLYVMSIQPLNDLTCFSMLLATIMSIFLLWIYCYFGQTLVDQRRMLQTELYFLKWYEAQRSQKIMILVTISVLQRDCFVYAGKIIPLSMETFGQVLLKAYTFFTFMNDIKYK
uniref:Odorant receptor n=1 Tax=Scaeva pyrastri TaxID=219539 RepID=A0A1B3B7B1_SCAPY|nr:putative odorant receptor OR28 [Scaeva pyrastri]